MIGVLTRNMPDAQLWARLEVEAGVFHHQNLALMTWIERMLSLEVDTEMLQLERIKNEFLHQSPYV